MECEVNSTSSSARSFAHHMSSQQLYNTIDITHPVTGEHTSTLILAHVKHIHVRKDMLTERGGVDPTKFKPVARMGDISYARVGDAFRLDRPGWAQAETTIQNVLATLATL